MSGDVGVTGRESTGEDDMSSGLAFGAGLGLGLGLGFDADLFGDGHSRAPRYDLRTDDDDKTSGGEDVSGIISIPADSDWMQAALDLWLRAATAHLWAPKDPALTEVYRDACHDVLTMVTCPRCDSIGEHCPPGRPDQPPRAAVQTSIAHWIHTERVDAVARLITEAWERDQRSSPLPVTVAAPRDFP